MSIVQIRLPQTPKQRQLPPFLSIPYDEPTSYNIKLDNQISTLSINPNTATIDIHNSSLRHTLHAHTLTVTRHLRPNFINIKSPSKHLAIQADQYETLFPQLSLFALSPPNFLLLKPLGAGITSSVFLARDIRTSSLVAVRLTRSIDLRFLNLSHEFAERALHIPSTELPAHPCIHQYTRALWHQGNLYAVSKYMNSSGRQLLSLISQNNKSISVSNLKIIMNNLLSAISHMHSNGFVHGNISPQHILIQSDEDIVIGQIHDVTLTGFSQSSTNKHNGKTTKKSNYVTRVAIAPPEGINFKNPSPKADVWAAGLILRQLMLNVQSGKQLDHFNRLMSALLQPVPSKRLTARAALEHSAFSDCPQNVPVTTATSRCERDVDARGTFRSIVKKAMVMSNTVKCWQKTVGIEVGIVPFTAT